MNIFCLWLLIFGTVCSLFCMEEEQSELIKAVLAHDFEAVRSLKEERGVDPKQKDIRGLTAFNYAAKKKENKKIAAYLFPDFYDLPHLEYILGHNFKKIERLVKALTPCKYCPDRNCAFYEWFGSAIVQELLMAVLAKKYEGAKFKDIEHTCSALMRKEHVADLSKVLGLESYCIKGKNWNITLSMLKASCMALIAALYKDGGPQAAQNFILRFWLPMLQEKSKLPRTPESLLSQWRSNNNKKITINYETNYEAQTTIMAIECTMISDSLLTAGKSFRYEHSDESKINLSIKSAAFYRAACRFVELLPDQDELKKMLLPSPESLQEWYQKNPDQDFDLSIEDWLAGLPSNALVKLHKIAYKQKVDMPKFEVEKDGSKEYKFIGVAHSNRLCKAIRGTPALTRKAAIESAAENLYAHCANRLFGFDLDKNKIKFIENIPDKLTKPRTRPYLLLSNLLKDLKREQPIYKTHIKGGLIDEPESHYFFSIISGSLDAQEYSMEGTLCPDVNQALDSAAKKLLMHIHEQVVTTKQD